MEYPRHRFRPLRFKIPPHPRVLRRLNPAWVTSHPEAEVVARLAIYSSDRTAPMEAREHSSEVPPLAEASHRFLVTPREE